MWYYLTMLDDLLRAIIAYKRACDSYVAAVSYPVPSDVSVHITACASARIELDRVIDCLDEQDIEGLEQMLLDEQAASP